MADRGRSRLDDRATRLAHDEEAAAARIEHDPSIAARAGVDPSVVEVIRIALDA